MPGVDVVVAAHEPGESLEACLAALEAQRAGSEVEIRVVGTALPDAAAADHPTVRFQAAPADSLVPELWARGIESSQADWVALTIAHCVPSSDWLATLRDCIESDPGAAGFGGPIEPPSSGRGRDAAAFLVRYSAYLAMAGGEVDDLPGDNAVYRRDALDASWADRNSGFWESLVNAEMRRRGERLVFRPEMTTRLQPLDSAGSFWRLRCRHGRHFGSTRRLPSVAHRLVRAIAAPLLVPVLAWRFWHRIPASVRRRHAAPVRVLPWLIWFLCAWVAGETVGYLRPQRSS